MRVTGDGRLYFIIEKGFPLIYITYNFSVYDVGFVDFILYFLRKLN
jgi:hypothetical protein